MKSWPPAEISTGVLLAPKTTFGIGGACEYYAEPATGAELLEILWQAKRNGVRVRILGGGSNLLIADAGMDGLVISMSGLAECARAGDVVMTGAGVSLAGLVQQCAGWGLSGLEFLKGIPGTVGGAVKMNAGSSTAGIGNWVREVTAIDQQCRVLTIEKDELSFSYRDSNLGEMLLTNVELQLTGGDPDDIRMRASFALEAKSAAQPLGSRSAGCVFCNPPGESAGRLIDSAGLKGCRRGGAVVSDLHANYILNDGNATCDEVLQLIDYIMETVMKLFKIEMDLEICLWQ